MKVVTISAFLAFSSALALAQPALGSPRPASATSVYAEPEQLWDRILIGHQVAVTTKDGDAYAGRVVDVSTWSIVIDGSDGARRFNRDALFSFHDASRVKPSEAKAEAAQPVTVPARAEPRVDVKAAPSAVFHGSKSSDKFHRPTCEWAGKIAKGNLVIFESREAANAKGYKPCRVCNP